MSSRSPGYVSQEPFGGIGKLPRDRVQGADDVIGTGNLVEEDRTDVGGSLSQDAGALLCLSLETCSISVELVKLTHQGRPQHRW